MLDCRFDDVVILDGSGRPGVAGQVGIRDGRLVAVGRCDEPARRVIQGDGAALSPGFVDIHVHYDAQASWDPALSPSCLHGVTTVVGGNCGFSVAPMAPQHSRYIAEMLARVEGMPIAALVDGVAWDWTGFGEWLGRLDGNLGVNAGFFVGHSTVRRYVMGDAASERSATDGEIAAMVGEVDRALDAGALGLSTSVTETHHDGQGRPVPSRFADDRELLALMSALAGRPGTTLEITPRLRQPLSDADRAQLVRFAEAAGRPLVWNALLVDAANAPYHESLLALSDAAAERGQRAVALTLPGPLRLRLSFQSAAFFEAVPGWEALFSVDEPTRLATLADPVRRAGLRAGLDQVPDGPLLRILRFDDMVLGECRGPGLNGRRLGDIAVDTGRDAFDVCCDVAVAEGLGCGFWPRSVGDDPASWAMRAQVWRRGDVLIGGGDAGAHLDAIDSFAYPTELLGPACRDRGLVDLATAVRWLTTLPAEVFAIPEQGGLRPGWWADLVLFDPATIAPGPLELRNDLPGDGRRLWSSGSGIRSVWVNGQELVAGGEVTTARSGQVIRAGRAEGS
jgi:N-acyl-D-aspartate/D-glutamate deacylase